MVISEWQPGVTPTLVLLFLAMACASGSCDTEEPKAKEWDTRVSARKDVSGNWNLDMSIKYLGARAIEIGYADIPWNWTYATQIAAVKVDSLGEPLAQSFPVDDPPPGTVKIEPKGPRINNMNNYFAGLMV